MSRDDSNARSSLRVDTCDIDGVCTDFGLYHCWYESILCLMNTVCIAFLNSKGGVGKTTSAVNTAAALAELGRRVLLLDMDAQSHVASHLGLFVEPQRSIDAVLMDKHGRVRSAVRSSPFPRLDVVLSTRKLEEVERLLPD